jgi:hypothetical protein
MYTTESLKKVSTSADSSIRCVFGPVSDAGAWTGLRDEKRGLHKISTLPGTIILRGPFDENADSSIRCNSGPVWSVSDGSGLRDGGPDLH